jgi:hypothetical protein
MELVGTLFGYLYFKLLFKYPLEFGGPAVLSTPFGGPALLSTLFGGPALISTPFDGPALLTHHLVDQL